jgi:tetratricopeptide (TPR) repeat protein
MSNIDWPLLLTILVILLSGATGGMASYYLDVNPADSASKEEDVAKQSLPKIRAYLTVGIASAFTVPLFLHTASSNLLEEIGKRPSLYFVLAGFCIVAAISARRLLPNLADKAFQLAGEAKNTASSAIKKSNENLLALEESKIQMEKEFSDLQLEAVRQKNDLATYLGKLIDASIGDASKISHIVNKLGTEIKQQSGQGKEAELLAWRAYCFKRQGKIEDAIADIERAISLEPAHVTWHHNRICYLALANRPIDVIIKALNEAENKLTSDQKSIFCQELLKDDDLKAFLASNPEFVTKIPITW